MSAQISRTTKCIALSLFLTLFFTTAAVAQQLPESLPSAVANGKAAINALGNKLPAVAQKNGMTAEKLEEILNKDKSLFVDSNNELFYVEESVAEPSEPQASATTESNFSDYSADDAFNLNSRPGSQRTIYLDFDGHTITGTAWNNTLGQNTYQAAPFDLDGNPSNFSTTERLRIIGIWKRVAEDFASFDVNVTTQYTGEDAINRSSSSDQVYGTRALITKRFNVCSGCGGVAYLGVFDSTGDYYQPALVFYDALGSGNEKYTAEATSHEVGHNLGLNHDGTSSVTYYQGHGSGETGWAPIMGSGYYKNLTQWSKGEYAGANNKEDDYAVMQNNGLGFASDEHGDSISSATQLPQGNSFTSYGVINERTDKDFFEFYSGVGDVQIDVERYTHGPNLDIAIKVYNASGQLIAQANPDTTLNSSLMFSAPNDGAYFVSVDGVGRGDANSTGYTDYGVIGQYKISGTISTSSGNQAPVAIASANPLSGQEPLVVNFDGLSSYDLDGTISSYSWDFNNGASSSNATAQQTFSAGTYLVTLTVTDDGGFSSSDQITIVVTEAPNIPPVAKASATPTSGMTPLNVSFSSSGSADSDGTISAYSWNFGDGSTSTAANPSHTYTSVGVFTATLTVTDNDGDSHSASVSITVNPNPTLVNAPSGLTASVSTSSVDLSWSDNSSNEDAFEIFRGLESGKGKNRTVSWSLAGTVPANSTSFTDTGLSAGTYHYKVVAYRIYNSTRYNSNDSNSIKVSVGKSGGGGKGKGGKK